ncbi:restriction endonuclease subunit S [Halomonas sp. 3H]|uniref:restriction endonuclease subunit S n=1 Tax=Halomonas sp. 3H TaxID=2952527 RepID=UPI0020B6F671|nr:restriction endonuclease subunit S [Halomonas sp. 3H]
MSEFSLVPLGQLAEIRMGQSPDSTYVYEGSEQGVPFLQGNAEFGVKHPAAKYSCTQPAKIAEQGSSLISVRAPVGETNIADQLYCIGRGLAAVKFHHYGESLGRELLSFNAKKLDKVSQGTTFAAIGGADLRTLLVADIPNQEAKVLEGVLDTLDTQIQKTEALIAKLEKVKEGLLHDLLTRGIDENSQLRPSPEQAPELYKESPLGLIPREWLPSNGAEACKEIVVGIVIKPTQYYRASGVPILRSANVRENRLSLDNLMYMSQQDHKAMSKSAVKSGDVLTVRTGYPGTSCVVDGSIEEANCVDIIISRVGEGLDPKFWSLWINSDFGKGHVLKSQGGLAQQHFNVGDLKKIQFPLPTMTEQLRIVGAWRALQKQIQQETTQLAKIQLQKHSLMDDLLTGRVRVTPLLDQAQTTTPA